MENQTHDANKFPLLPSLSAKDVRDIFSIVEAGIKDFAENGILNNTQEDYITQILVAFITDRRSDKGRFTFMNQMKSPGQSGIPDIGVMSKYWYHCGSLMDIEAKRLYRRTSEYVVAPKIRGGIERFKKNKHGRKHADGIMLGYVQKNDFPYWFEQINKDIAYMSESDPSLWSNKDKLKPLSGTCSRVEKTESTHKREGRDDTIRIVHLWRDMSK